MKKLLGIMLVTVCLVAPVFAGTVESQNVVGFFKVDVNNTDYTLVSVPMQKLTVASGTIDQNLATNEITVTGAGWKPGEFSNGVESAVAAGVYEETGRSTYYVEITSGGDGAYLGRHFTILNNTPEILTIDPAEASDVIVGSLNTVGYKIVPANRIRDILGEPLNPILETAINYGQILNNLSGDKVLFWAGSNWDSPVWHQTGVGWKYGATTPADDMVIGRDEGFFVKRFNNQATNFVVTGEVSANSQNIILCGGYNLIGGAAVVDKAIGETTLSNIVVGAINYGQILNNISGDRILEWSGANWGAPVWYDSDDLKWVQGPTTQVDDTFTFEAGKAYFLKRETVSTEWTRKSPLE